MFLAVHLNRKESDKSINRTKMGGYRIDCHMVAELNRLRRPNARNRTSGEALTRESTTPFLNPAGDMAGAKAMKTSTFSFKVG